MDSTTQTSAPSVASAQIEVESAYDSFEGFSLRRQKESQKGGKYRAIVVEGDDQVRKMLIECLRFCNFDATGYADADVALREIFPDMRNMTWPDLFVIDLQLREGRVYGMNLIEWLIDNNVPSAIMATSANLSNGYLVEAMKVGAEDFVSKPPGCI